MNIKLDLNFDQLNKSKINLTFEQLQQITIQARENGIAFKPFDLNLLEGKLSEKKLFQTLKTIEVKKDYMGWKTGNIVVEYECNEKPSGIAATKSNFFCYELTNKNQETVVYLFLKTSILKNLCRKYIGTKNDVYGGDGKRAKMIKLPIKEILTKEIFKIE
jgi:hypothetical protein